MDLRGKDGLEIWRRTLVRSLTEDGPDLSARQMAILLSVHGAEDPYTVRGLATSLGISKPAVTRAIDRLEKLGFLRRRIDERDRRSIFVEHTVRGSVFLSDFGALIADAASSIRPPDRPD